MVGKNTLLHDDPLLTCRRAGGRDPHRVVLDARLDAPLSAKVYDPGSSQAPTIVIIGPAAPPERVAALRERGVLIEQVEVDARGHLDPEAMLRALAARGLMSVLVEGGGQLAGALWDARLVDRVYGFVAPRLIGGTMGSHLIVDNATLYRALDGQMIYYENEDGRICIVFPYLGKVLVGSTEVRIDDPDTAIATAAEQDYILASLAVIFPAIKVAPDEIVFRFAGVRPLPASAAAVTGRIPRDHYCELIEGEPPVLCMIGGKWTTFRSFGALAADTVMERLGVTRTIDTASLPVGGGRDFPQDPARWIADLASRTALPEPRLAALLERYGTRAAELAPEFGADADIAGHSAAELTHLIAHEQVETLADLLLRRTTIAITGALSLSVIARCLDLLSSARGWTAERAASERQSFLDLLASRHGLTTDLLSSRDHRSHA